MLLNLNCLCHIFDGLKYFTDVHVDVIPTSLFNISCHPWKHHSITKWPIKNLLHKNALVKKRFFVLSCNVSVNQSALNLIFFQGCSNVIQVVILAFCKLNNQGRKLYSLQMFKSMTYDDLFIWGEGRVTQSDNVWWKENMPFASIHSR